MSEPTFERFNRREIVHAAGALLALGAVTNGITPANAASPRDTLIWALHPEPTLLVGAMNTAFMVQAVSSKIFDGLLSYDQNLQAHPSLATAWTVSPDGRDIMFKLRPGVRWHDGTPFTSADVKFTFEEVLKKVHPRGASTFANLTGVDTPDVLTAVFKLNTPSPYILAALSGAESPIVPKHLLEGKDLLRNAFLSAPVGTGPFQFVEWQRGNYISLKKNPNYWQPGKPSIEKFIIRFIPDEGGRAAALESGEVDIAAFYPVAMEDLDRFSRLPNVIVSTKGNALLGSMFYLEFNVRDPLFADVRVRQAIAHGIDKEFVRKTIWRGYGEIATGPFPATLKPYYTSKVASYPFDVKRAEALLDAAGYPRKTSGTRFRMSHSVAPANGRYRRFGEYFKQAMATIGIDVDLRAEDMTTFLRKVWTENAYQTQAYGIHTVMDPTIGVQRFYWSKSIRKGIAYSNGSGYSSPAMDELWQSAQTTIDANQRRDVFHKIQTLAMTDLPIIPLMADSNVSIYNKRIESFGLEPEGIFGNFANLKFQK